MANPVDIGLKIAQALDSIGIKLGSYIGKSSNVKKAMFGNKPTMFKSNALQALRGDGKNFDDALRLIEEESQFIVNATDAEKVAFLNNLYDYKELGGPLKKDIVASKQFEEGIGSLKDDIESLQTTTKTMKEDAEKGLKSAEDDLKTFLETGGNPLKKKEPKYLGGSMHEEGQLRTAIRTFLKNEYKNGRIKLDKDDQFRVMEYSPMLEDDPIKVFKKIYGDKAYNKAGTFPGAFEIGEDFNHYRTIFESKMGEDILKVKDKKYVGDGTLLLTDEVITPTPDDDIPFAEGGIADVRPGFVKGTKVGKRIVEEIVEYITSKFTPMDAMKEVNKVIGKTGKYKNLKLTQKDIDEIVEGSNDFIFQRDPDNLFVEGSIKERTEYLDDADKAETFFPKTSINKSVDDMSIEESLTTLEGLGGTKIAERFKLKQKYPGISEDLLTNIIEDTDPVHKASVLAKMDQAMKLIVGEGKGTDEAIDILKSEPKTKMATGGRAGFSNGGTIITLMDGTKVQIPAGSYNSSGGLKDRIYSSSKGDLLREDIVRELSFAKGGRAGYYGGGQAMIEPDLSDIGHGSDSLMARTRLKAPGSQATTSTGLNYLLGEDNDNIRIPFNEGLLVPPKKPYVEKPYTTEMFEDESMTLLKGMYGTGPDSNEFLYNEMIKKGNKLREKGVERETVIEIIRKNKDKIDMILKQQTGDKKSLAGLSDGGIAGLRQGYNKGNIVDKGRRGFLKFLGGTTAGVVALKAGLVKMFGKDSGAISKKVIDEVIIDGSSGAPAWLQPLVNKALREGKDISQNAIVDGQVVKSLDTPTGKVDVYYNTRTGEVEIDYIGGNTALGESVNMKYTPGIADEGTRTKPADEFEANEAIPQLDSSSGNFSGSHQIAEMGENVTTDVKGLYSDTSELAELGGEKLLIKDISESIKKKKILKEMDNNPEQFAMENAPEYYD